MATRLSVGLDRRRLRLALAAFFLALAVPAAVLVHHAYGQLKWEAFAQHRALAEEFAARVDARLAALVRNEEARSYADYAFLTVAGDPAANLLQRSDLAAWPVPADVPGLVGHFQVDAGGHLGSPLLPDDAAAAGVAADELAARVERVAVIERVLAENRLVRAERPAAPAAAGAPVVESKSLLSLSRSLADVVVGASDDAAAPASPAPLAESALAKDEFEARQRVASEEQRRAAERSTAAGAADLSSAVAARTDAAGASAGAVAEPQAAFDALNRDARREAGNTIGRVEELDLDTPYVAAEKPAAAPAAPRAGRKEQVVLPQALPAEAVAPATRLAAPAATAITTFESELDPFEFSLLASGHFVLYRNAWRDGQRIVQGLLVEQQPFLAAVFGTPFRAATLARTSDLAVAWRGDVLAAFGGDVGRAYLASAEDLAGTLLHRARLSAPLADLELVFTVRTLPAGPGADVLFWTAAALALVLAGGFWLMDRAGGRQIDLALQQQDFVAAVSHELKTPLTSIRMYGEMLRAGWVEDEARRRGYYDYIVEESERLSRLIGNVLQLARMTRNGLDLDVRPTRVATLADGIRSKVSAQVERAGFTLELACDETTGAVPVLVDDDAFSQVVINLVDNALKFAAGAERRVVQIAFRPERDGGVTLAVRDFGPGVPRGQMKRIFRLFYRAGSELTRETAGTGIGLALVRELARGMGATADVVNVEPGAEFRVRLRAAPA